jgi:hypothetical protein
VIAGAVAAVFRTKVGDDQVGGCAGGAEPTGRAGCTAGERAGAGSAGARSGVKEIVPERSGGRPAGVRVDLYVDHPGGPVEAFDDGDRRSQLIVGSDGLRRGVARSGAVVGQGSSSTRSPGLLNEVTILVTMGVGQVASGSMGVSPHAQTVAGVGAIEPVRTCLWVPARSTPCRGEAAGEETFG